MKINLNDSCTVTLTEVGVQAMRKHYEEFGITKYLHQRYPNLRVGTVIKTQLWELFQVFGPAIQIGFNPPFETNFEITPS